MVQKLLFRERWAIVPVIGPSFGDLGLPRVLTGALVLNCVFNRSSHNHWEPYKTLEAANLLFISRTLEEPYNPFEWPKAVEDGFPEFPGVTRLLIAPFSKVPMLWAKLTSLSTLIDQMGEGAFVSMMVAISLSWYASCR